MSRDYVATRKELMRLLQQSMTPIVYERFVQFYNDSARYAQHHQNKYTTLQVFDALLKAVPNWNNSVVEHEEQHIKNRLPNFYGIYKALWVATLKVISSVRLGTGKDIETTIKPVRDFVHQVYKEVAVDLIDDPGLLDTRLTPEQRRKNHRETMALIAEAIPDAFRNVLPFAQIYEAIDEDVHTRKQFDEPEPEPEPAPKPDKEPDSPKPVPEPEPDPEPSTPPAEPDSPKPVYGSPPEPEPFTDDRCDGEDDDPYLKDLPKDYDGSQRPEPEDDYPDSEDGL